MAAKTLMIQGTASHVGKSVLVAALCRLYHRRGIKVAPFKAQNMSNNSFVTPDGKEIGRAQAVQAAACRLAPRTDFNPVLIKPEGERCAQLVVNGTVAGRLTTEDFGRVRRDCFQSVREAFGRLRDEFDLIVLEGAGSPAEINLREQDIVNMGMAQEAGAPVLLVGDIDRGGVFAALVGTMTLLTVDERKHIKGFVINKFRGDETLLAPGIRMIEPQMGIRCLGVIPHWGDLQVPQEDSLGWNDQSVWSLSPHASRFTLHDPTVLTIGVADVPAISNFTDFDALAREPDVELVRVTGMTDRRLDALIFPGSKNTAKALRFLKTRAIDLAARRVLAEGGTVVGLCGGFQMLGTKILDPAGIESAEVELQGLALLDTVTTFEPEKVTVEVTGVHRATGCPVRGYEVHMGRTQLGKTVAPLLEVRRAGQKEQLEEGAVSGDGKVFGTYLHGLFDAPTFRRLFLNRLREARGWPSLVSQCDTPSDVLLDQQLDRLADFVAKHLDLTAIDAIIEQGM